MPGRAESGVVDYLGGVLNSAINSNPYYTRFANSLVDIPALAASEISTVKTRARTIIENEINPAYRELTDFMFKQLDRAPADIGVGQFPKGDAYYRERIRYHSTTSMSPEQAHELDLWEVARVQTDLRQKFGALGYPVGESLRKSFDRVAAEGGPTRAGEAIDVYEALIDEAEL